ncbi:hypothetical protein ACKVMT_10045 [Halobacteriales archaeon Cl-PHB]
MIVTESIPADAVPFNEPVSARVDAGKKLTATFEPVHNNARFAVPILAASKHAEATYEVRMDDEPVYGPAPIPPTDIDDLVQTFMPPREFTRSLTVICRNVSSSTTRRFTVQPVGWEVAE